MNRQRIEMAVRSGLSFVCATCRKYWMGIDAGRGRCLGTHCGSPLKGLSFPEYDGLLTTERFADWCFVCGAKSEYGVVLSDTNVVCGLCARHLQMLHPRNAGDDFKSVVLRSADRGTMTIARLFGPVRRTFLEEIHEVEKYFAEKEGRPFVADQGDSKSTGDAASDS